MAAHDASTCIVTLRLNLNKHAVTRLLEMDRLATLPPHDPPEDAVLRSVRNASKPSRVYWLMNALASLIACYGLLANRTSPAHGNALRHTRSPECHTAAWIGE